MASALSHRPVGMLTLHRCTQEHSEHKSSSQEFSEVVRKLIPWRDTPMSHAKQLHPRHYLNDHLESINREGLPGNVKNNLGLQVQAVVITAVQQVIEPALEEKLRTSLGLDCYEHLPWGRPPELTRSGSYRREFLTQYGPIAALRVPKLRRGHGELTWQSMTRDEHCGGPLLAQPVMGDCWGLGTDGALHVAPYPPGCPACRLCSSLDRWGEPLPHVNLVPWNSS
jgi:hypothetical protein